jgi:YVTN family beta-propeller protein
LRAAQNPAAGFEPVPAALHPSTAISPLRRLARLALPGLCVLAAQLAPATAVQAQTKPVFVLNSLDASVSMIDAATATETKRIPTGKEPHHLYLTPDEKSLMVANAVGNSILFLDPLTGAVQRTVNNILDPYQLRFTPDMKWFITAANRLNHVDIYKWQPEVAAEPLKLVKRFDAPRTPSHLYVDSKSSVVYASLQDSDELVAIDLGTMALRWKISVGKLPADVYLSPDDKRLFVGLTGDRFVEVYDVSTPAPAKLITRIPTGEGAHAFRAKGDGKHLFVSNRVANTVSLIDVDALKVVNEFPGPGGPDCMDITADGKTLILASRWARKVTFVDIATRQVVKQVNVGRSPHGVWTLDHAPRR